MSSVVKSILVLYFRKNFSISDKLKGFRLGADDYMVKPFNREELLARIDAIIRRTSGNYGNNILEFKNLKLDSKCRRNRNYFTRKAI